MAGKAKPLRGRSEFIRPDGTVVPVRDFDGNLVIAPGEWEQINQPDGVRDRDRSPRAKGRVRHPGGEKQRDRLPD